MDTDPTVDAARLARKLAALQNEVPADELERRLLNSFTPKELTAEALEQLEGDFTAITPEEWETLDEEGQQTEFMALVEELADHEAAPPRFEVAQYEALDADKRRAAFATMCQVRDEADRCMRASIEIDEAQWATATFEEQRVMLNAAMDAYSGKVREQLLSIERMHNRRVQRAKEPLAEFLGHLYSDGPIKKRIKDIDSAITYLGQAINAFRAANARDIERRCIAIFDELAWNYDISLPPFPTFRRCIDLEWHMETSKRPPDGCTPAQFRHRKSEALEKFEQLVERTGKDKGRGFSEAWRRIVHDAVDHIIDEIDKVDDGADPPVGSSSTRR